MCFAFILGMGFTLLLYNIKDLRETIKDNKKGETSHD